MHLIVLLYMHVTFAVSFPVYCLGPLVLSTMQADIKMRAIMHAIIYVVFIVLVPSLLYVWVYHLLCSLQRHFSNRI